MRAGTFLLKDKPFGLIRLGFCSNLSSISGGVYKVTVFSAWSPKNSPLPTQSKEHRPKEKMTKGCCSLFEHGKGSRVPYFLDRYKQLKYLQVKRVASSWNTEHGRVEKRWLWLGQSWWVECQSNFWKDRYLVQLSFIFQRRQTPTCLCLAGLCFVASFPKRCLTQKQTDRQTKTPELMSPSVQLGIKVTAARQH